MTMIPELFWLLSGIILLGLCRDRTANTFTFKITLQSSNGLHLEYCTERAVKLLGIEQNPVMNGPIIMRYYGH